MNDQKFSWHSRWKSFGFAFEGVVFFFRREHNAWLHGAATIGVLLTAFFIGVTPMELIAILIAIGLVWITEIINTSIEGIMDHLSPLPHPSVKIIKDLAAGAVLVAAIIAFIIGLIIFIPKLL